MSDGSAAGRWVRSLLGEVANGQLVRPSREQTSDRPAVLVADAKSVYDHFQKEKGAANAACRVSLELNLLWGEMSEKNLHLHWVPTTHQAADVLTK